MSEKKVLFIPLKVSGEVRLDVSCVGLRGTEEIPLLPLCSEFILQTLSCPIQSEDWYFERWEISEDIGYIKIEIKVTDRQLSPLAPNQTFIVKVSDLNLKPGHIWNNIRPTWHFTSWADLMNNYVQLLVEEEAEIIEVIEDKD